MSLLNYKNKELIRKARHLRSNSTKAEIILWSKIRSQKIYGLKFRRQQPIVNYIVDFYCDKLKLIIEVDGEIHSDPDVSKYDQIREKYLKNHGFEILRFENFEVETEIDKVIEKIKFHIQSNHSEEIGYLKNVRE